MKIRDILLLGKEQLGVIATTEGGGSRFYRLNAIESIFLLANVYYEKYPGSLLSQVMVRFMQHKQASSFLVDLRENAKGMSAVKACVLHYIEGDLNQSLLLARMVLKDFINIVVSESAFTREVNNKLISSDSITALAESSEGWVRSKNV